MDELGRPITDLFGIDLVYGYLLVGMIIGFIVGRVTAPKRAPQQLGGDLSARAAGAVQDRAMRAMAPEVMERISALLARGEKIEAVKQLREATGFGLAEAKQVIDRIERQRDR